MNHFAQFLAEARERGMSMEEAVSSPAGRAAARQDDQARQAAHMNGTRNQYIEQFHRNRKANGINNPGFLDQDEMLLAMSDPAYHTSQEYRDAVEHILSQTPAEVLNVSIDAKFSDGSSMKMNHNPNAATVESMLDNARRDALKEHIDSIDQSTAKGRYELMKFIAENPDAANAVYQDLTPDQFVTEAAMLADQQDGKRDEITIPAAQTEGGY